MSNNILTHSVIAREAAAMFQEATPFISRINRRRERDFAKDLAGYNIGQTVGVKIPPASQVFTGATFAGGGNAPDQVESTVNLTVSTQQHVPLAFTALQKAMFLTEFKDRFLKPAIQTLASQVQYNMLQNAYKSVANTVGLPGSIPTSMLTYGQMRAKMENFLAPDNDRTILLSSEANLNLVDASKGLLNPTKEVQDMFYKGYLGSANNMEFFECQSLPVHTLGNQAAWTINGASQSGSTLLIGGLTNTQVIKAGTVFTIPGVYAVHPLLGTPYPYLRQFVVTADYTAVAATGSISIYPAINWGVGSGGSTTMTALPTVSAAPTNGNTVTLLGAVSTGYRQGLAFQRDAFAAAFVPLPVLASCEGYTFTTDDFSIRVMTFGDGLNDLERTRIDVLWGMAAIRPDHACRYTE
jgi:hypothetical protein